MFEFILIKFIDVFSRSDLKVSFGSVSRSMYKARNQALPKSPKTAEEIIDAFNNGYIMETYGTTKRANNDDKRSFFKHAFGCEDYSFCVFASDNIIDAITNNVPIANRKLYADGTFKITPDGVFKQVLIVFGELNECVS